MLLFRHTSADSQHPTIGATLDTGDAHFHSFIIVETGLLQLQLCTRRSSTLRSIPTAVCHRRYCMRHASPSLRSGMTSLASDASAQPRQVVCPCTPMCTRTYTDPRPTQPSIPPGSVNEYQLRLGRQRQVLFIPLADVRGVCR